MAYWLFKSEPGSYSIQDLERDGETFWDGVRNYQARNLMRDEMKQGDMVFFYHSNAEPPGIVGLAKIVAGGSIDQSAFQAGHHYFDPKSSPDKPRWYGVTISFVKVFKQGLSLAELREIPGLEEMLVLRKGQRLSVQPVTDGEAKVLLGKLS
jgi:predicted RNA-binding protein with PUA-like domain